MELTAYYDAQRAIIGSALLEPKITGELVQAVREEDFNVPELRTLYAALRGLFLSGRPVDPVLLVAETSPSYEPTVREILRDTPTAANWRAYAKVLRESAALRAMQDIGAQLAEAVDAADARRILSSAEPLMLDRPGVKTQQIGELFADFLRRMEDKTKPNYLPWGIRQLDEVLTAEPGDFIALGADSSVGKTALAVQLAWNMASRGRRVGFFSLETNPAKLTDRLVSSAVDVDFNDIKRQQLRESDWQRVAEGGQDFTSRRLVLIRGSGMTASQIQAVSRSYGFEVIFVDYVQLIAPETDPRLGQTQAMAAISRSMHMFAQSSGTLVVELSQLSRPQKQGGWKEPTMHDLKETGQLEQDADMVMLLYKPGPKDRVPWLDEPLDPAKSRILKIDKQKEGRLGRWPMFFDGAHQRFSVMAGPDGQSVLRHFTSAGKAQKTKARAQSPGQIGLREISPHDLECPFPEKEE